MPDWRFQPCDFSAHGFFVVNNRINQEPRKPGMEERDFRHEGKAAMGSGEEATAATEFQKNLRQISFWLRGFQIQSL